METGIVGADVLQTSTSLKFRLGAECTVGDATYKYVKAGTAVTANKFSFINATTTYTHTVDHLTTGAVGSSLVLQVCCPQVSIAASSYGWVVVKGLFTGFIGASCVQGVKLYTTATTGMLDDASTTYVEGVVLITTVSAANQNALVYAFKEMSVNN